MSDCFSVMFEPPPPHRGERKRKKAGKIGHNSKTFSQATALGKHGITLTYLSLGVANTDVILSCNGLVNHDHTNVDIGRH